MLKAGAFIFFLLCRQGEHPVHVTCCRFLYSLHSKMLYIPVLYLTQNRPLQPLIHKDRTACSRLPYPDNFLKKIYSNELESFLKERSQLREYKHSLIF